MWPFKKNYNLEEIESVCRNNEHTLSQCQKDGLFHPTTLPERLERIDKFIEGHDLTKIDQLRLFEPNKYINGKERVERIEAKIDLLLDHLGLEAVMSEPSKLTLYEKEEE